MKERHKVEFGVGDTVTYAPYETEDKMYVVGIRPHQSIWGHPDVRVWYQLSKDKLLQHFTSETTGLCIKESIYFKAEKLVNE